MFEGRMTKDDYVERVEVDMQIAFKNESKMLSGVVKEVIHEEDVLQFVKVETNNGSIYRVKKVDIAWVKTGSRWPVGIFNAMREGK